MIKQYTYSLIPLINAMLLYPVEMENKKNVFVDADEWEENRKLAKHINEDEGIKIIVIQYEFGFEFEYQNNFISFLHLLKKPIAIVFEKVLPISNVVSRGSVQRTVGVSNYVIAMNSVSADLLSTNYQVAQRKISLVPVKTQLLDYIEKMMRKDN